MISISNLKNIPDNPIPEGHSCPMNVNWSNNIRYEIWDRRKDKPLFREQYICYASLVSNILERFKKEKTENRRELVKHMFIRFYCKNGDNKRRIRYLIYIMKIFEPLFRRLHIHWLKEEGINECVIDAYFKLTTPLDAVYAFGAFIRTSWEQWHYWGEKETRNFKLLCQSNASSATGHIPLKFLAKGYSDFKDYVSWETVGKYATAIVLDLIHKGKVYDQPVWELVEKGADYMGYQIQISAYTAVIESPRFQSYQFKKKVESSYEWS